MTTRLKFKTNWLMIFFIVFALYTIWRFGYYAIQWPGMTPNDYAVNHRAAERLLSGQAIYQAYDDSPFKYSPTFLFFFTHTFHHLSVKLAWLLWCALSIGLFSLGSYLYLIKTFPSITELRLQPVLLLTLSVIGAWHGYLEHFSYGQIDFILFSLWIWICILDLKPTPSLKRISFLTATAILIKPQSAILIAYFLIQKRFKILSGIFAASIFLLALPYLFWSDKLFEYFTQWKHCIQNQSVELLAGNLNQSLASILARITHHPSSMLAIANFIVVVSALGSAILALKYSAAKLHLNPAMKARLFLFCMSLYMVATPLSWRWLTFWWMISGFALSLDAFSESDFSSKIMRGLLYFAFGLTLIQNKQIAFHFGIQDTEPLSYWGLYGWVNVLLLVVSTMNLTKRLRQAAC